MAITRRTSVCLFNILALVYHCSWWIHIQSTLLCIPITWTDVELQSAPGRIYGRQSAGFKQLCLDAAPSKCMPPPL